MVTIDDRLYDAAGSVSEWWQRPRTLKISLVLPLALAGALAVAGAAAAAVSAGWFSEAESGSLAAVSDEVTLASGAPRAVPPQACARIQEIVRTACGYKQHDHDPDSIHQCVSYELKYTMWSAYGCQ